MARSGRFGRLPRRAPNLTGEIVAMAEAYERQREQNLLAAWNSGGTFEGKKATDGMVLKFWKKRMNEVSKDDPLYEYYKNLHQQYTFSIAESKMTLAYAQNRISEGGVASFYRRWAKKVPRRSEIYRELMRNAARFANAAGSGGGGGGGGSSNKAAIYAKRDRALYDQYESAGVFLEQTLTAWMRSARYLTGAPGAVGQPDDRGETLADITMDLSINDGVNAEGEGKVTENDPGALLLLLDAVNADPEWSAYMDREMKRRDPTWTRSRDVDQQYLVRTQRRRLQGLRKRVKLAKRFGVSDTDIQRLKDTQVAVKRQMVQFKLLDEMDDYAESRADFDSVFNDPDSSFSDLVQAWGEYEGDVARIADDVRKTKGQRQSPMLGALNGEIAMMQGRDEIAEGRNVAEGGGTLAGEGYTAAEGNIQVSESAAAFLDTLAAVESGRYGIIEVTGGEGNVFGGRNWSLVDMENPELSLGTNYVTTPAQMGTYERTTYDEPKTEKEKFFGFGKRKKVAGGGFTYTEFHRTVPIRTVMPQVVAGQTFGAVDSRTGAYLEGAVSPRVDELVGFVIEDAEGNPIGYGVLSNDGTAQFYDVSENPFNLDLLVDGKGLEKNQDGIYVAEIDPSKSKVTSADANSGMLTGYDPREFVKRTKVKGQPLDLTDPESPKAEGSPTSSSIFFVAQMAKDEQKRRDMITRHSKDELMSMVMNESNYKQASPQTQQQMLADFDISYEVFKTSTSQEEVEQRMAVYNSGGDPTAGRWNQAESMARQMGSQIRPDIQSGASPPQQQDLKPELDPSMVGAESWEDVVDESGTPTFGGGKGLTYRQEQGLSVGALEYDESGGIRVSKRGAGPETQLDYNGDAQYGDAWARMVNEAKAKVMSAVAMAQQAAPDPKASPRIDPPTVSTPDAATIGPVAGPSPSPAPSPRIAPPKPPKNETPKPEATPKPTPKPTPKEAPPGTKGSPFHGPVAPEHVEKPVLDITKPLF